MRDAGYDTVNKWYRLTTITLTTSESVISINPSFLVSVSKQALQSLHPLYVKNTIVFYFMEQ